MEFRILGPLEVVADGRVVALDAAKPRALLAILLLHAGEPVSRDRLIEDLWAGRPPATAAKVLQTYVSQLRKALGSERDPSPALRATSSSSRPDGRSICTASSGSWPKHGRATPADATARLREALSLWRGPPLAEFAYERVGAARDRPARGASPRGAPGSHRRDLALGA